MATKQKFSIVFPAKVKPVRNGVYRRQIRFVGARYSRWQNGRWYMYCMSVQEAANARGLSTYQDYDFTWWGLAEEPKP